MKLSENRDDGIKWRRSSNKPKLITSLKVMRLKTWPELLIGTRLMSTNWNSNSRSKE